MTVLSSVSALQAVILPQKMGIVCQFGETWVFISLISLLFKKGKRVIDRINMNESPYEKIFCQVNIMITGHARERAQDKVWSPAFELIIYQLINLLNWQSCR